MKRFITILLATVAVTLSLGGVAAAAPAANCRNLVWLSDQNPPSYATWVDAIQGYRHGHFWSSSNCDGVFVYWGQGLAFESGEGTCAASVRVVLYDRNHNYDRATSWTTDCVGGLPVAWIIGRGREFSFDVRHRSSAQRSMESHAKFNPVTF